MQTKPLSGYRLVLLAIVCAALVVVLGAFTRLVHAGLGCPDWPTCYGHLWIPTSAADIEAANLKFADTPVETDKTWPEQLHRAFASSLGLLCLALVVVAVRRLYREGLQPRAAGGWVSMAVLLAFLVVATVIRALAGDAVDVYLWPLLALYFLNIARVGWQYPGHGPLKLPFLIGGLVILQGLFGMWTVTLKLWPQVVTAHLLGGFTTLGLLWLLAQRLGRYHWALGGGVFTALKGLRGLALAAMAVVFMQIALGGWTSANYAALACPDLPTCQGYWWPPADFTRGFDLAQHVGPNYLGGLLDNEARVAIHMSHRLGAVTVLLVLSLLIWRLWRLQEPRVRVMAGVIGGILALQILLGLSNIIWALPLSVAVAHNGGGALLLLALVTLNHRIFTASTEPEPGAVVEPANEERSG
ncbi:heme A synthase [Exilibacterium tricleocarpae]|uniref:Heme A synthase n=1 Tax=Exilibacterium tricleocarpae TaxID=2591008 RepID=A0A545T0I0_9GAMM|nr:COX15/CtaA family protein [Exilibacterium tricleocarpae]TQV70716.1 heme A synthase [Exilibacterium tricleocarpae]